MKTAPLEKKKEVQKKWFSEGENYATAINNMVEFCEKHGWENWKGEEPDDNRENLAQSVFENLKEANKNGNIANFRAEFPPAHAPFIALIKTKSQEIKHLNYIGDNSVIFNVQNEKNIDTYLLKDNEVKKLQLPIEAFGKSKLNNLYVVKINDALVITEGWQGNLVSKIKLHKTKGFQITKLIPFNNGLKVILVSPKGIYIVSEKEELKIHPASTSEDSSQGLIMENASISTNNEYIIVGDLNSDHRVLNAKGEQIGTIGPQSSFPHFSLFNRSDSQLIVNSCHFYNGVTIGIETKHLKGIEVNAYEESDLFHIIENQMRVYAGINLKQNYVLGDAFGYIKAFDFEGNCQWKHFLGSTITDIVVDDNKEFLWVSTGAGMLHKLHLNKGLRDSHTIGNSNHFEVFRYIFWKDEPVLKW